MLSLVLLEVKIFPAYSEMGTRWHSTMARVLDAKCRFSTARERYSLWCLCCRKGTNSAPQQRPNLKFSSLILAEQLQSGSLVGGPFPARQNTRLAQGKTPV